MQINEAGWRIEIGETARAVGVFAQHAIENGRLHQKQEAAERERRRLGVEQQGAATQEIACNINQAATRISQATTGTQQVTSTIGVVTAATTNTGAAASQVPATGELSKQADRLRSQVVSFLAVVKAA